MINLLNSRKQYLSIEWSEGLILYVIFPLNKFNSLNLLVLLYNDVLVMQFFIETLILKHKFNLTRLLFLLHRSKTHVLRNSYFQVDIKHSPMVWGNFLLSLNTFHIVNDTDCQYLPPPLSLSLSALFPFSSCKGGSSSLS